jgi:hypothetical protein
MRTQLTTLVVDLKKVIVVGLFLLASLASAQMHPNQAYIESDSAIDLKSYYLNGGTDLEFRITVGQEENYFLRRGINQSQTVLMSGARAQIETAFLAGNSSAGLFIAGNDQLKMTMILKPSTFSTDKELGVRYSVGLNQSTVELENVIVGSTRDYRDYEHVRVEYADAKVKPSLVGKNAVVYSRERLDHGGRYQMQITVLNGIIDVVNDKLSFKSPDGLPLLLSVEAITSEPPITPLAATKIFSREKLEQLSVADLEATMFLVTGEKIVAGGHRYLTYFGRDVFLTLIYNAEVLQPEVMEVALAAAFEREAGPGTPNGEDGDIAHEEDIGDRATRDNIQFGRGEINTPTYDYKMIDTVYLLAPMFDAYMKRGGVNRAAAFLNRSTTTGRKFRDALIANLQLVLNRTNPFVQDPAYQNLISFREGLAIGDWRDSSNGHGSTTDAEEAERAAKGIHRDRTLEGGRFSFGVNVALVPSALRLASEFFGNPELGFQDFTHATQALKAYNVWNENARPLFQQIASPDEATIGAINFTSFLNLPAPTPLNEPFSYSALSLDRNGQPIKVVHSDEGFDLLLNSPTEAVLNQVASSLLRKFPYGLNVPGVGMGIETPILTDDPVMFRRFNPAEEYHAGVWGCDMAKMERAFEKQLRRADVSEATHNHLLEAHREIWKILNEQATHKSEEVWSWKGKGGQPAYVPFKEGNALQLWNLSLLLLDDPYKISTATLRMAEAK